MTTARPSRLGDRTRSHSPSYYEYLYSPPVSPKSQPHGYKRKASSHDSHDESENQSLISNSFKKLRLNNANARRPPAVDLAHGRAPYGGVRNAEPILNTYSQEANQVSPYANHDRLRYNDNDDCMPLDDTADRIWVHDLGAEIAEIEAEEAKQRSELLLSEAGNAASKIPDHLLKQKALTDDPASNMQVILYRDPISISVPEEDDAVRRTIIDARKRMRQKQLEDQMRAVKSLTATDLYMDSGQMTYHDGDVDMDLD